jgi:hypothetical protein
LFAWEQLGLLGSEQLHRLVSEAGHDGLDLTARPASPGVGLRDTRSERNRMAGVRNHCAERRVIRAWPRSPVVMDTEG